MQYDVRSVFMEMSVLKYLKLQKVVFKNDVSLSSVQCSRKNKSTVFLVKRDILSHKICVKLTVVNIN